MTRYRLVVARVFISDRSEFSCLEILAGFAVLKRDCGDLAPPRFIALVLLRPCGWVAGEADIKQAVVRVVLSIEHVNFTHLNRHDAHSGMAALKTGAGAHGGVAGRG